MKSQLWTVVGGAAQGGIIVRTSQDTNAPQEEARLSKGAIIRELALEGERLQYRKLQGSGPVSGWVSLKFRNTNLIERTDVDLEPAQCWRVVGGQSHNGILVRSGKDTSSPPEPVRLSFGALVRELTLDGERLYYELIEGNGPDAGWVSIHLKDTPLLVKSKDSPSGESSMPSSTVVSRYPLASDQKMRVLAIHGLASNSNIMKMQVAPLKRLLGKNVEWLFIDAKEIWRRVPDSFVSFLSEEKSEAEKLISQGKDFYNWWNFDSEKLHSDGISIFHNVTDVRDHVMEFARENGPIDVAVCWSQGSNVVSFLIEVLRREGKELPWRLNVFFSGGMIDDHRYEFSEPSAFPTIRVTGGKSDLTRGPDGEDDLRSMYSNFHVIEHADGHAWPSTQPHAGEIYKMVAAEMWKWCQSPGDVKLCDGGRPVRHCFFTK